jgi:DNA phosphorothioation-associated DGQHR protein 1
MSVSYPFTSPGFLIVQPFGEFFVTTIPARVLLDVAYSDRLTAERQTDGTYLLGGSQRSLAERRLKEIAQFIDSDDASFPNAIILAANYSMDDGLIEENEEHKWKFTLDEGKLTGSMTIPTSTKLAPIIDGQHRLFGYNFSKVKDRLDTPFLCAIFFDLPKPYQAFLFATINSNQRPVSKSLTYELFGYNVENESPEKWTPEKLAVFLARKLLTDRGSPFFGHIIIAAENDFAPKLANVRNEGGWAVSIATIVEGILRLISQNPKRDAYKMGGRVSYEGNGRSALTGISDKSPLRPLYLSKGDDLIYSAVKNFFMAAQEILWRDASSASYIHKTVGIQALFDISRDVMPDLVNRKDIRTDRFATILKAASRIDYSDRFFQTSGTGRQRIRTCLELALGLKVLDEIKVDREDYERLLKIK